MMPLSLHHSNSAITLLVVHNFISYPHAFTYTSTPTHRRKSSTIRAIRRREWQEYEQAVKDKDLSRALRFLRDDVPIELQPSPSSSELDWFRVERDWEVLDTCLNADDMRLVATAYAFLNDKGLLPNFGKYRSIVLEGPRDVTPTVLKSSTGLDVTKLSPKKWGLSGTSSFLLATLFAGVSILLNQGIDIRPNIAAVLGLAMLDAILLGGSCLALISSFWPPYKRRICVHEAGHLLVGKPCFCQHFTDGLSDSWCNFRPNYCNADGHSRTGISL